MYKRVWEGQGPSRRVLVGLLLEKGLGGSGRILKGLVGSRRVWKGPGGSGRVLEVWRV